MAKITSIKPGTAKETKCFTYEVTMLVQILAEEEKTAREQLDTQGGYVTKRDVVMKETVSLFNGNSEE